MNRSSKVSREREGETEKEGGKYLILFLSQFCKNGTLINSGSNIH